MEPTPKKGSRLHAALLLIASAAFAAFPAYLVYQNAGGQWQDVPPEFVTDSLYYYAQMREVADGHPMIGNPYFLEHRDGIAPAFFIPVVVAAIPLMVGVPLTAAIILNLFFWSAVFLYLAYRLLRELELSPTVAVLASLAAYFGAYMFMVRPVAMQIVFPVFLFFLLALLRWIRSPNRTRSVTLAFAIALAPYTYTYLAYIVLATMIVAFLWHLTSRRMHEVRLLLGVGIGAALLVIPFIWWTLIPQILHPDYAETAARIGLVFTHIPANEFFFYGRWVVLAIVALALLRWGEGRIREVTNAPSAHFFLFSGFGLLAAAGSNILTGTELSLAIHVGRFILLWFALAIAYLLCFWFRNRTDWYQFKNLAAGALILLGMVSLVRNLPRSLAFMEPDLTVPSVLEVQSYAAPLAWLSENAKEDSVVWSNDAIATYVPILTPHYVLFAQSGNLQLMPDRDVEDRYLLSRFATTTRESLVRDLAKYSAAGLGKEQPIALNREAAWCTRLPQLFPGKTCGTPTNGEMLAGEEFFNRLLVRDTEIRNNRIEMLKDFKVKYVLIDLKDDPAFGTLGLRGEQLFGNGRFEIYGLNFE